MKEASSRTVSIRGVERGRTAQRDDLLAVEEPLEIRIGCWKRGKLQEFPLSITMRTPGQDRELAAGFLFTEGIIASYRDIDNLQPGSQNPNCNTVRAVLRRGIKLNPQDLRRHFYATSSCGVCGKASLEALRLTGYTAPPAGQPRIEPELIRALPPRMQAAQAVFDATGGLHAAALFSAEGELVCLREDVGRHNALDKVIGAQLLAGKVPLHQSILMVSGRTSFEILQKALSAGIPVVAAVSAPSTLAVELARQFQVTLLGFVRGERFNIYADADRIACEKAPAQP